MTAKLFKDDVTGLCGLWSSILGGVDDEEIATGEEARISKIAIFTLSYYKNRVVKI